MSKTEIKEVDIDPVTETDRVFIPVENFDGFGKTDCPIHGKSPTYTHHVDSMQWGPTLCFKCVADATINLVRCSQERFLAYVEASQEQKDDSADSEEVG